MDPPDSVSLPVPSLVICEMPGVPYADHVFFQEHTVKVVKQSTPPEERWAAMTAIQGYMAGLIAEKEKNPPDDLLGRQIVKLRADGAYWRTALTGMGRDDRATSHTATASSSRPVDRIAPCYEQQDPQRPGFGVDGLPESGSAASARVTQ
ncbi:hypothetical protein OG943_15235 [Amycolatopsis sp. NBC_00345]|uniref:hypothetical protein n=1 Tax=Amycolatopsis sp. NBC_00345 TaxID=2975955 RepID=UPI002E266192